MPHFSCVNQGAQTMASHGARDNRQNRLPKSKLHIPAQAPSLAIGAHLDTVLKIPATEIANGPTLTNDRAQFLPLLGDHNARSARRIWGNYLVAGLGSHWAGVRVDALLTLFHRSIHSVRLHLRTALRCTLAIICETKTTPDRDKPGYSGLFRDKTKKLFRDRRELIRSRPQITLVPCVPLVPAQHPQPQTRPIIPSGTGHTDTERHESPHQAKS
jgi:hypothetical protein